MKGKTGYFWEEMVEYAKMKKKRLRSRLKKKLGAVQLVAAPPPPKKKTSSFFLIKLLGNCFLRLRRLNTRGKCEFCGNNLEIAVGNILYGPCSPGRFPKARFWP